MKLPATTPASISFRTRLSISLAVLLMVISVPVQFFNQPVAANSFEERIKALEQDISRYESEAAVLAGQADTLQREVARFNAEKATIQAQVNLNQARYDQLVKEIAANEKEILENRDGLGTIIADLYIGDSISPIEMLASSQNIGDFLNKQEFRTVTRDELSSTIAKINDLKKDLEKQQVDVVNVLADKTQQRNVLAAKEAEQQKLLNATRGDEVAYRNLSEQSQSQKLQLQREQQAAIEAAIRSAGGGGRAVAGDPNKGGYPAWLANSNYYSPLVDPWGMFSRQCVSYTAWKVFQKNGFMPFWGGIGNAKQWPGNAQRSGIPVSTVPRAGSVGVIMAGQYGHTVWVESVNANGTVNISQYNFFNAGGSGWGHYSEMFNVSPSAYDYYIYF